MEKAIKLVIAIGIAVLVLAIVVLLLIDAFTKGKVGILNVTGLLQLR